MAQCNSPYNHCIFLGPSAKDFLEVVVYSHCSASLLIDLTTLYLVFRSPPPTPGAAAG